MTYCTKCSTIYLYPIDYTTPAPGNTRKEGEEMPRARNIKPGFFKNEMLGEMPYEYRLLFIGLWTLADRCGRLEDRPKRIKGELFPYDSLDVDQGLNWLAKGEDAFILRYEGNGGRYIQILHFEKHQSPHFREQASTIPAPGIGEAGTMEAQLNPHSLIPDTLIPDSLTTAVKAKRSRGSEGKPRGEAEGFNAFWTAYPRKVAKQNAMKAWQKLNPAQPLQAIILQAVESQKASGQWQREGGQFIPYPATWLNGQRFEDCDLPAKAQGYFLNGEEVSQEEYHQEVEYTRQNAVQYGYDWGFEDEAQQRFWFRRREACGDKPLKRS